MRKLVYLPLALLVAAGCGGGGDDSTDGNSDNSVTPDAAHHVDAAPGVDASGADASLDADDLPDGDILDGGEVDGGIDPDADPATCAVASVLGAVTPLTQVGYANGADPTDETPPYEIGVDLALNTDALPDVLQVQLWDGLSIFEDADEEPTGLHTGTFDLSVPAETNYQDCGACVRLKGNNDDENFEWQQYMPTAGTLTVTSLQPTFAGSISNLTLVARDDDDNPTCTTTITSLSFSADATTEEARSAHGSHHHAVRLSAEDQKKLTKALAACHGARHK